MDPLCDVISLLRPHAAISKAVTGKGRWGIRYDRHDQPGFALVLKGQCWLRIEGEIPRLLERGDFLLLPTSPAFEMFSDPAIACSLCQPTTETVRHGDPEGEPDLNILGGTFRIERANESLLLDLLPQMIHIRAVENDTSRLSRITTLIMEEGAASRPGRDLVLERLLEVMLIEALRWRPLGDGATTPGLLAGLREAGIDRALRAMHSQVQRNWTVSELARLAAMSRSAFAGRFTEIVGCAPMEYLSRWRISLAQDALSHERASLDSIAQKIGYNSASAFSTAFRRRTGHAPGAFARAQRQPGTAAGV